MMQALHIFRKDLRHQRIDLALYCGLLIFVGYLIPTGWPGHWSSNEMVPWLRGLANVALPITWLVLIVRLVHTEALVGDRQFWTTRPYRWSSLLSAKLLFVAFCIALPYLFMQCVLVVYGGLSPIRTGLLVGAGMHALIVWIPMFLLAALTSTLATTFFATLGTVVVWLAALTLLIGSQGPEADAPFTRPVLAIIFAAIFLTLLVSLYKQRKILQGRILFAASAVVFLLLIVSVSKMSPASLGTLLLTARYPSRPSPFRLVYDPTTPHTAKGDSHGNLRYASIPIQLAGLPASHRLHNAAVQYRLDTASYHYSSPWRPAALGFNGLRLLVPDTVLDRAGHADAHLSIQFVADEITPGETQTTDVTDRFLIPGGGACVVIDPRYERRSAATTVVCRYAFSVRQPVEIQAHLNPGCRVPTPPPVRVPTYDAGTSADPLTQWPVNVLTPATAMLASAKNCAVRSLTTTLYRTVNRFRTSVDIPSIRLADDVDD